MSSKLQYIVARGRAKGTVLTPHQFSEGHFVVSRTRFAKDYVRVSNEHDLPQWIAHGYGVRMSNPTVPGHRAPSLISAAQLAGQR